MNKCKRLHNTKVLYKTNKNGMPVFNIVHENRYSVKKLSISAWYSIGRLLQYQSTKNRGRNAPVMVWVTKFCQKYYKKGDKEVWRNGYICLPKVMQTCANCLVVRARIWLRWPTLVCRFLRASPLQQRHVHSIMKMDARSMKRSRVRSTSTLLRWKRSPAKSSATTRILCWYPFVLAREHPCPVWWIPFWTLVWMRPLLT